MRREKQKSDGKAKYVWQKIVLILALAAVSALCIWLHMSSLSEGGRIFPVRINEVLASNTRYPNEDGRCCDYIELYNSADYSVDLTGFQLGDIAGEGRYKFRPGTVMAPKSYLVVYFDKKADDPAYGSFGISRAGDETYYLVASNDAAVDRVTTVPTDINQSMVRISENEWGLSSTPTPGKSNRNGDNTEAIYNAALSPVCISEFSSAGNGYIREEGLLCDWVELHNTAAEPVDISGCRLSDNVGNDKYIFPEGTVLQGGEYFLVYCSDHGPEGKTAPFSLSREGGEQIVFKDSEGGIIEITDSLPMETGSAVQNGESHWKTTDEITPGFENSPGGYEQFLKEIGAQRGNIVISEAMAGPQLAVKDSTGAYPDWVELLNRGDTAVDLTGWFLSDDCSEPQKWQFPSGRIQPGERMLVFCSGRDTDSGGELHTNFSLSNDGEQLILSAYPGIIVDRTEFGETPENCSWIFEGENAEVTELPTPGYENSDRGYEMFLDTIGTERNSVVISEIMAASQMMLPDAGGNFPDWVELFNQGETPVNLTGWFLSDDWSEPQKWQFPETEIRPGERMLVFCSGKDTASEGELHTNFSLSSEGEQLILSVYPGAVMDRAEFGKTPEDCAWIFDGAEPVLTKHPTPGYPNDEEGYEQFCAADVPEGPLAIWEVMTYNDWYLPQALGECYDWAELKNISDAPINLGEYSITDDPEEPGRHILPEKTLEPGKTFLVILSGDENMSGKYDNAGFSLNALSDNLLLFHRDRGLQDFAALRAIPRGQSYGRAENAGGFYYMEPTPGKPNAPGARLISNMPVSDYEPGTYSGETPFDISLQAEGEIHYTLDGSIPTENSELYTGPIRMEKSGVLRAAAMEPGKLKSRIYTATFVVGEPHDLPVVSLVTDPGGLWGSHGIYKNGNMSLKYIKVPANVSYKGADGCFSRDCEMSLHGATTVIAFNKKSFAVRFGDVNGGPLHYDVFGDGEILDYRSLILRSSYESTFTTHMHDAFIGQVAAENCPTLISQKYKYAALYLNGEYWGLYAIREKHSPEHYAAHMEVPASTVTVCHYFTDGKNSLHDLYKRCGSGYLATDEGYAYAKTVLDMSSFADWIIMESYMSNADIGGNMRYYYSSADGLWRCGLVDADLGMAGSKATFTMVTDTWHHGRFMRALLQNREFLDLVASRLAELLAGPMSDENMVARVDEMADSIRSEVALDNRRWELPSYGWESFLKLMRNFCDGRAREMIDGMCQFAGFGQKEREHYFGELLPQGKNGAE